MKSSPSPPAAPDPTVTAGAQTQSNLATAIANAELNRVSQQTPWGSINYSVTGKNPDGTPIYSSNIALSPAQQQLLNQQQGLSSGRNTLAQQILGNQSGQIAAPINFGALAPIQNHGQTYTGAVNAPSTQAMVAQNAQPQQTTQSAPSPAGITPQMLQQLQTLLQGSQAQPQQPQPAQQPQAQQTTPQSGPSSIANMNSFLGGQNPFGSSGMDIMNTIAQSPSDPRLSNFYSMSQQGSEDPTTVRTPNANSRLDASGAITNPNNAKDPFVQVGNLPDGRVVDMSKVTYDPTYGAITTQSNINQKQLQNDAFSTYFPMLAVGGGIAGPALSAAASGLMSGAATTPASTAFDPGMPGYASEIGQTLPQSTPTGAFDMGGSTGFGGTQPLPSSFGSQLQALGQHGVDNLASGRGLFGFGRPTNTALSALIQALRTKPQGGQ